MSLQGNQQRPTGPFGAPGEHRSARQEGTPVSAVERIELSRARLRAAMLPRPAVTAGPAAQANPLAWLEHLKHQPTIAILLDTVQSWWMRHPLRAAVHVASEAGNALARPIAQHNPLMLVVVAAMVGAVLAWSRPWRWAIKPALFAGLLPQLVSRVVANLPLESWLSLFGSSLSRPAPPTEPPRNSP